MTISHRVLIACCLSLCTLAADGTAPGMAVGGTPTLDLAAPYTWEAAVSRALMRKEKVTRSLLDFAQDKKFPDKVRAAAILLLGEIGSPEAIDYMLENLEIELAWRAWQTEGLETPCTYTLRTVLRGNWKIAPALLRRMNKHVTRLEWMHLPSIFLYSLLDDELARTVIDDELAKRPADLRKKNLEHLRKNLR